jgi:hypothetical protein
LLSAVFREALQEVAIHSVLECEVDFSSQDRNCNGLKMECPRSVTNCRCGAAAGATIIGHFESFRRAVLVCSIIKTDIAFYLSMSETQDEWQNQQ